MRSRSDDVCLLAVLLEYTFSTGLPDRDLQKIIGMYLELQARHLCAVKEEAEVARVAPELSPTAS